MDQRSTVRAQIVRLLSIKGDRLPFEDGESLLLSGRLDSLNVLELVTFLEKEFHYSMTEDSFDPSQFDSVDSIVSMVAGAGA